MSTTPSTTTTADDDMVAKAKELLRSYAGQDLSWRLKIWTENDALNGGELDRTVRRDWLRNCLNDLGVK